MTVTISWSRAPRPTPFGSKANPAAPSTCSSRAVRMALECVSEQALQKHNGSGASNSCLHSSSDSEVRLARMGRGRAVLTKRAPRSAPLKGC